MASWLSGGVSGSVGAVAADTCGGLAATTTSTSLADSLEDLCAFPRFQGGSSSLLGLDVVDFLGLGILEGDRFGLGIFEGDALALLAVFPSE